MKKEKREIILKKLEKSVVNVDTITWTTFIMALLILCILGVLACAGLISAELLLLLVSIIVIFGVIMSFIILTLKENIANNFIEYDEIKLKTLNELAGDGNNLKEFVILNDREIIEEILRMGIDKLVIRPATSKKYELLKKDSKFKLSVSLKNGTTIESVSISDEDFFKLLSGKLEDEILNEVITDINLYKEEDYPEGETDLIISGANSLYYETSIKEEDLLDIFDLKDDE